jgi:hypothetical protein
MTSRFLLVLEISRKEKGGFGMTSRILPVLEVSRTQERRFWWD